MKTLWKKNEKISQDEPTNWQYKLYITNDSVNNQLVESLAPMNWEEFLNRKINKNEDENVLVKFLIPNENYIIGKRLVRYIREIPNIKVIVCELARLTPLPAPTMRIIKPQRGIVMSLDDVPQNKENETKEEIKIKDSPKGEVYV